MEAVLAAEAVLVIVPQVLAAPQEAKAGLEDFQTSLALTFKEGAAEVAPLTKQ
jgi:hypothetical protein